MLCTYHSSNSVKQEFKTLLLLFVKGAIYRKYKESSASKRNFGGCVISILTDQNKSNEEDLSDNETKLELVNLYHQNCDCHNEDVCKMACNLDSECKGFARSLSFHTCKLATTSQCPKGCKKSTTPYQQGSQLECYIKEVR